MGKVFPLLLALIAGGVIFYLYSTGQLAGVSGGANLGNAGAAAGQGIQKAKDTGAAIYAQPWFWAAAAAIGGATLLRWLWSKMSGPIRGAFIVASTIAAVVFVTGVHR